jgi:hypothetical protein
VSGCDCQVELVEEVVGVHCGVKHQVSVVNVEHLGPWSMAVAQIIYSVNFQV